MAVHWTRKAHGDLVRLHGFLAPVNPEAATRAVQLVLAGVRRLAANPRLGTRLTQFPKREVRRIVLEDYELRYELKGAELFILRLWHVREDR